MVIENLTIKLISISAIKYVLRFQKYPIFAALKNGFVAEWLGRALQKLVQQFESARNLT